MVAVEFSKKRSATQNQRDQAELVRTIGQRLREARELCNMSQLMAAEKLGYANSSKLAKIENASDTNSVPLWLIVNAAKLYDVSIDFLFGLSDDWERDARVAQERDVYRFVKAELESNVSSQINQVRNLKNQVDSMTGVVGDLAPGVRACQDALDVFRKLNPEFDDMPGGAPLVKAVDRAMKSARESEVTLRRFRVKFPVCNADTQEGGELLNEVVKELAKLSPLEYDQVRIDQATRLGVRVAVLDEQVKLRRKLIGFRGQLRMFVDI